MDNHSNTKLLVIVDENTKQLDAVTERLIFCLAEVPLISTSKVALNAIREFGLQWRQRNPLSKFHLADFKDEEDINTIIQMVIDLRPTIKLFVFYDINQQHRKESYLQQTINITRRNNYRNDHIQWIIESAEEYMGVVKMLNLTDDAMVTIISDVFCNIFARILDISNNKGACTKECKCDTGADENEKIKLAYSRIKPLIRLQFFKTNEKTITFSKRKMI